LLLSTAAALLVGAFVYAMFAFLLPRSAPPILLPTPGPAAADPGEPGLPDAHGERRVPIAVGRDNILSVLETVRRPRVYAAEWQRTLRWAGGESTVTRRVYANGDFVKTEWFDSGGQAMRHVLTGADRTFLWFPGDTAFLEFPGGDPDGQNGLAAYEPLTLLASEAVTAAGYVMEETLDDTPRPVLWLTVSDPELELTATYRIALDTGLMLSADIRDEAGRGVSLQAVSVSLASFDSQRFSLPDGRFVWDAASAG